MRSRGSWVIRFVGGLLLLATAVAAPYALPQQPGPSRADLVSFQGRRVSQIQLTGIRTGADSKVSKLVVQKEGEPLDREKVRQTIRNLFATGRYVDIAAQVEPADDGSIRLTFAFTPNYFVGVVNVEGAPERPTPAQIVNASKLDLGEPFAEEKLNRGLDRIRQLLSDNGFYQATVAHEEVRHPETQQIDVLLKITHGEPARVGQLIVQGDPGMTHGQVEDVAHIHPGDVVTSARLNNGLERLRNRYRKQERFTAQVSLVGRDYHVGKNTLDYTFHIERGPVVEIQVEGFRISKSVLRERVPVFQENSVDDDLLNEGRVNLADYLQARGYFDAKIEFSKKQEPDNQRLRIIYDVNRGSRHKLVKIEVTGNKNFATEELTSRMQVQAAGRLFSQGRFSESLLKSDIKGLKDLYRAQGFQQVNITPKVEDNYLGREDQLAVFLNVDEGERTLVGATHFEGNLSITEEVLREQITSNEGQPYSEYNLSDDRDLILTYYLNHGYPEARLDITSKPGEGPYLMDVTFRIREGEQVVVDRVLVTGLETTRRKVVEREILLHPSDPLSQNDMYRTQQRLYDLGIFSQVDVALQDPAGKERDKNVLVDVKEAKRYTFNYGFGFEAQTGQPDRGQASSQGRTGASPRVSFDVTRLNFRGLNHTISFKSNLGALQQRALLNYRAPRWFDSEHLELNFNAFYDNTLSVTTFTSRRLEGNVQATHILDRVISPDRNPVQTLYYRFSFRQVRAEVAPGFNPNLVPLLSRSARVGGPGLSYLRDKRDSAIETRKGNYTALDFGWAGSYFGSEADFTRVTFQNSTYHAFGRNRRFVFARSTRLGFETAYRNTILQVANVPIPSTSTVIPLPERLFAGGGNSHRGFSINQAGPRDLISGQPLGGSALFLNNLELRLPPVKWPYVRDNLSFVIFNDAGNVFDTPSHLWTGLTRVSQKNQFDCKSLTPDPSGRICDFNNLVFAIGTGLHYKTPIGPVRLDLGYNLNPPTFPVRDASNPAVPPHLETVRRFNLFFSIGQTF